MGTCPHTVQSDNSSRLAGDKLGFLKKLLGAAVEIENDMKDLRVALAEWGPVEGGAQEGSFRHCFVCKKDITGKTVFVGDDCYHEACFLCHQCGCMLTANYFKVGGNHYCEAHKEVALPKCSSCRQPLQSGSVSVMGCSFHPQCFTCSVCGDPITGNYIPKEGGKFICEKDFQKTEDACAVCGEAMVGRVLSAVNKQFHPACFRCCGCNKGLEGMPFYNLEGEQTCGDCYQRFC